MAAASAAAGAVAQQTSPHLPSRTDGLWCLRCLRLRLGAPPHVAVAVSGAAQADPVARAADLATAVAAAVAAAAALTAPGAFATAPRSGLAQGGEAAEELA